MRARITAQQGADRKWICMGTLEIGLVPTGNKIKRVFSLLPAFIQFPHCPTKPLSAISGAYVELAPAISISADRTQMATNLGRARDFPRLEPRRANPAPSSVRAAARQHPSG